MPPHGGLEEESDGARWGNVEESHAWPWYAQTIQVSSAIGQPVGGAGRWQVRGIGCGYLVQCRGAGADGKGQNVPLGRRRGLLLSSCESRSSLGQIDGQLLSELPWDGQKRGGIFCPHKKRDLCVP